MQTKILILYLIIINVITFGLYGIDKYKAVNGHYRISEKMLLGIALIGGSIGALAGMFLFRHKTKHWQFRLLLPLFFILHLVIVIYLIYKGIII